MAYTKTNWVNGYTPLNASNMNKIEEGIYNNDTFLSSLDIRVNTLEGSIGQGGIGSVVVSGNGNALTNASYNSSTKILNFEKNNNFALDSDLDSVNEKNLYHLGAYDSVNGNTITRQTGYRNVSKWFLENANNLTFRSTPAGYQIGKDGGNGLLSNPYLEGTLATGITNKDFIFADDNASYGNSSNYILNQSWISLPNTFTTKQSYLDYFSQNEIIIQYKLASSYTEQINENQPLTTLDQSGSQWLRSEWEKGLNVFNKDNPNLVYGIGYEPNPSSSLGNDWVKVSWIPVKPNTTYSVNKNIRYSLYNGNSWSDLQSMNVATFTTASDTRYLMLIEYAGGSQTSDTSKTAWANLMLTESSHPYPYQEYRGGIVRESQAVKVKTFNGNTSTFNDFKTWMEQNSNNVISVIYYDYASGNAYSKNVIFNIDDDVYKYINSEGTFDNVSLSDSSINDPDIIKVYYK